MGNERSKAELVDRAVRGDRLALTMLITEAETNLRRRLAPKIPADMKGAFDADDLLQLI